MHGRDDLKCFVLVAVWYLVWIAAIAIYPKCYSFDKNDKILHFVFLQNIGWMTLVVQMEKFHVRLLFSNTHGNYLNFATFVTDHWP